MKGSFKKLLKNLQKALIKSILNRKEDNLSREWKVNSKICSVNFTKLLDIKID